MPVRSPAGVSPESGWCVSGVRLVSVRSPADVCQCGVGGLMTVTGAARAGISEAPSGVVSAAVPPPAPVYPGLSADPDAPEFVGDALARSELVRFVSSDTHGRPEATPGEDDIAGTGYAYADVRPGASALPTDYDLIGCASNATGLFALEQLPRLDLLCVVPPDPRRSLGPVALFAAERYCRGRQALLLTEQPTNWRLTGTPWSTPSSPTRWLTTACSCSSRDTTSATRKRASTPRR